MSKPRLNMCGLQLEGTAFVLLVCTWSGRNGNKMYTAPFLLFKCLNAFFL